MGVMTAQQVLPMTMVPGVVRVGAAADLLEDSGGGEVFIHGNLTYAWSGDDQALRRLTAVQLVEMQVAKVGDVADAFGVDTATLWRWRREFAGAGVGGLVPDKRGPKGASKLTASVIADIRARRQAGASLRAVAAATGLSTGSVRRALTPATSELDAGDAGDELARCRGQRSAHAPGGDPRRGGDRPQRRTSLPARADVGDHACCQLRGALGAPLVRREAAHTGPGELAAPTPQRGRVDTERVGDIADLGNLHLHELDRRQTTQRLIIT